MYVFEFTDKKIIIYDKKKSRLYEEIIPDNIFINNRLYDYKKFVLLLKNIVNKNKVINSIFRIKVKILLFEEISPSEIYLLEKSFLDIGNFNVSFVNVSRYFEDNYIFISGNNFYFHGKLLNRLVRGKYILVGYSSDYANIKNKLVRKYKIELFEYENSNTIIYEKV